MANQTPSILITAKINESVSLNNIIANLKDMEKQIQGITVKYNIDDSMAKKAFSQMQSLQNQFQSQQDSFYAKNINGMDADIKKREQQAQSFSKLIQAQMQSQVATENQIKAEQKEAESLANLQNRAQGTYGNFLKYINDNTQAQGKMTPQINEIKDAYVNLQKETDFSKAQAQYKNLTTSVTAFKGQVREAGLEGKSFFSEIGNDLKKFAAGNAANCGEPVRGL
jgi:chromosome segregation ATPase